MKRITLLIALVCFLVNYSDAQVSTMNVTGAPKEEPGETVDKLMRDANMDVCAGLIIYSDLTGLSFNSANGIVKRSSTAGKDFLFLSPDERMVEVFCSGYTPLKIILSDLGIRLKSGRTWSIHITGNKKIQMIPVNLILDPADAEIIIDGKNIGSGKVTPIGAGIHTIEVVKNGFKPFRQTTEISAERNLFTISLAEIELIPVKISSIPTGAMILINNERKGETDKTLQMYPGRYSVKLLKNGYADVENMIAVSDTGDNTLAIRLEKNSATLIVLLTPADAHLLINREEYSGKPEIDLYPGRYSIEAQKDGYIGQQQIVELLAGQIVTKEFSLVEKRGFLDISVFPEDADVTIVRSGSEPISWKGTRKGMKLPTGLYQLTASSEGYWERKKNIPIEENATASAHITLKRGGQTAVSAGEFVFVSGGTFSMGSDTGDDDAKPVHSVTVSDFYIGKYEVTQKLWKEVMKVNTSRFQGDGLPVEQVEWREVQQFIQELNRREGSVVYRLPTEAEWEYAARGGCASRGYQYSGSDSVDTVGWYNLNSEKHSHPVGTKKANELGIFDMTGNVWEWCSDYYGDKYYAASPPSDPQGPPFGREYIYRGGSWWSNSRNAQVTLRMSNIGAKNEDCGFRLIRMH